MFKSFILISQYAIPCILLIFLGAATFKKIPIYEVFIQGALEGLKTTLRLTPYLLAIFVAIGLFRTSGALSLLTIGLTPLLNLLHLPPDLLTLGLLKPLSGSASLGYTADLLTKYGPESQLGFTASLIQGSCETTFYVLSLYLGAVGIKDARHLLIVGLLAELASLILAVILGNLIYLYSH